MSIDFGNRSTTHVLASKDQFCFKRIRGSERSGSKSTTGCSRDMMMTRRFSGLQILTDRPAHASPHPVFDRMRFLFTMSDIEDRKGRRRTKSLSPAIRPSSRQALARSTKLINCIGKDRKRFNLLDTSSKPRGPDLVEPDGIEPTPSCLQSTRSPN